MRSSTKVKTSLELAFYERSASASQTTLQTGYRRAPRNRGGSRRLVSRISEFFRLWLCWRRRLFVISGYLITGNILLGIEAKQFSYLDFYARRCRRIGAVRSNRSCGPQ